MGLNIIGGKRWLMIGWNQRRSGKSMDERPASTYLVAGIPRVVEEDHG